MFYFRQEKEAADPAHLDNESPKVSPLKCVTPEPASYDRTPKSVSKTIVTCFTHLFFHLHTYLFTSTADS